MNIIDAHTHIGKKSFCDVENSDFNYNLFSTYDEIIELMDNNEIKDANTFIALSKARLANLI